MSEQVFTRVTILPSYAQGFTFIWDISKGFSDPFPWKFIVQEAQAEDGPWTDISPELTDSFAYAEVDKSRVVSKDYVLFFRIHMTTPEGTYISHIRTPYADAPRREYLIIKDIMRREVLQMRTLSGVQSVLWTKATRGNKCTKCLDPITGDPTVPDCDECFGTQYNPPYFGPYTMWATYSPAVRDSQQNPDGAGVKQEYRFNIRLIGFPYVKDQDVIVDPESDKRYLIDGVRHELEIRKVPVIQIATAYELPVTDPIYRLGTDVPGAPCTIDEDEEDG
jgi:hypothetical protein